MSETRVDKKGDDYKAKVDAVVKYRQDWLNETGFDYVGQSLVCDFAMDYAEFSNKALKKKVEELKELLKEPKDNMVTPDWNQRRKQALKEER